MKVPDEGATILPIFSRFNGTANAEAQPGCNADASWEKLHRRRGGSLGSVLLEIFVEERQGGWHFQDLQLAEDEFLI